MRAKVGLGVVAVFIALMAAPASGGSTPTLTVSPTSGPVGTDFLVSGDQCFPEPGGDGQEAPSHSGQWQLYVAESGVPLATGGATASETGVWEDGFPSDPLIGPLPGPGDYVVEAQCVFGEVVEFDYEPVTLTVTEVPGTAPPLVASTTTTVAPAVAASANPAFTG